MPPAVLTHSRLSCFRACPRRHLLRYEHALRPDVDGYALRVGSAFARAVEADANGLDVSDAIEAGLEDPYDLALVAAMFEQHRRRWAAAPVESVAAELPFNLPLVNPETGRSTPTWRLAGKIDRIVRLEDGRLAVMEYKTTSRDFSPGADYWVRLHLDQQLSIYVVAARALGYLIETVLYDVTRRPALRPEKATPVDERRYTTKASRLQDGTTRPAGSLFANQREEDETPEAFATRVAAAMAVEPERHFARIEIARLDQDLEDCRAEVWQQALAIRASQKSGHWYRNPDACFGVSGAKCDFLSICQRRDLATTTPDGFRRVDDVHPELVGPATEGGDPLHASTAPSVHFGE